MSDKQIEDLVDLMFDTDMEKLMKEKSTLEYIHKLQQEKKQLKSILTELEKWLNYQFEHTLQQNNYHSVLEEIQELKEKYK